MLLLVSCTAITAGGTPFVSANRAVRLTERAIRLRKRRFRFTVRAVRLRAWRRRKRRNPARNMFHVKQIKGLAVLFGWRSPAGFAGSLRRRSRVVFDVPGGRNQLREHRGFRTAVVAPTTFYHPLFTGHRATAGRCRARPSSGTRSDDREGRSSGPALPASGRSGSACRSARRPGIASI